MTVIKALIKLEKEYKELNEELQHAQTLILQQDLHLKNLFNARQDIILGLSKNNLITYNGKKIHDLIKLDFDNLNNEYIQIITAILDEQNEYLAILKDTQGDVKRRLDEAVCHFMVNFEALNESLGNLIIAQNSLELAAQINLRYLIKRLPEATLNFDDFTTQFEKLNALLETLNSIGNTLTDIELPKGSAEKLTKSIHCIIEYLSELISLIPVMSTILNQEQLEQTANKPSQQLLDLENQLNQGINNQLANITEHARLKLALNQKKLAISEVKPLATNYVIEYAKSDSPTFFNSVLEKVDSSMTRELLDGLKTESEVSGFFNAL